MKKGPAPSTPPVARGDYGTTFYSQEGEDMVLRRFVGNKPGFYVDIGAHHPQRFSNTFYFYQRGWRGINVDADPDLIAEFSVLRADDINVACAVGSKADSLIFYVFNERAVNTFDKNVAASRTKIKGWKIVEKRKISVVPLAALLDKHLPKGKIINFMSIDVEGIDLEVLQTNDWRKYRPRFLLVECFAVNSSDAREDKIVHYLNQQGYISVAKTYFTGIFADKEVYEAH